MVDTYGLNNIYIKIINNCRGFNFLRERRITVFFLAYVTIN